MKVLLIADEFAPNIIGGAPIIATSVAEGLAKGNEVVVITANQEKKDHIYYYKKIKCYSLKVPYKNRLRKYITLNNPVIGKKVERILQQEKPDVVNVHNVMGKLSYSVFRACKKHKKKVFWTVHDATTVVYGKLNTEKYRKKKNVKLNLKDSVIAAKTYYMPFKQLLVRKLFQSSVYRGITVSNEVQRALRENGLKLKYVTINNGVKVKKGKKDATLSKLVGKDFGILFAGRTSKEKGFFQAVKIVENLREKGINSTLIVAGKKMKTTSKHVKFTGWLDEQGMSNAYNLCKAVIVPSIYLDPFPTVNLEALAHKRLLITTCYGGSPEAAGDAAIIINPLKVEESAKKILAVIKDKKKMNSIVEKGYARYKQNFTRELMIEKYEKLFNS